jgi:hypothetical protein
MTTEKTKNKFFLFFLILFCSILNDKIIHTLAMKNIKPIDLNNLQLVKGSFITFDLTPRKNINSEESLLALTNQISNSNEFHEPLTHRMVTNKFKLYLLDRVFRKGKNRIPSPGI